jgi:hypothetical protein
MKGVMTRYQKRYVALLEVLIAFAIIVLCIIPLVYPHIAVVQSERKFLDKVELDHFVNLMFANSLQKLYENKIPWGDIESEKQIPIDEMQLQEMGLKTFPFEGSYRFELVKKKPPKPEDKALYLFDLIFSFKPKIGAAAADAEPLKYQYRVTIERRRVKE